MGKRNVEGAPHTLAFADAGAAEHDAVGGKGANLARLTAAGFVVPAGFTITTAAYADFMRETDLEGEIGGLLAGLAYDDADAVEAATARIRALIVARDVPAPVASAITEAYAALGDDAPVAVRSSGTAEDLEDMSFAGMHDTYLDVRGVDDVLDAVRRCWASLWTARATAYRHDKGFAPTEALLAVVVQRMVSADVAGVMFTANPVSGAVDEIVINASWGLGESVVSGLVTPDEIVVDRRSMEVRRSTVGTKLLRIVRNPDGRGTVEQAVPPAEQSVLSLTDEQSAELADLGLRVTEHYGGFPQDTEWAYADGAFHLLQARPVTGVDLSWDEDLEYFHTGSEDDEREDFIYTRAWSDDFSMAAITPLFYTTRTKEISDSYHRAQKLYGHTKAGGLRSWKYHKGEGYYSSNMEAAWIPQMLPKHLRNAGTMSKVPPSWWPDLQAAPFSWLDYLKTQLRVQLLDARTGPYRYTKSFQEHFDDRAKAEGIPDEKLRKLSDRAFEKHLRGRVEQFEEINADQFNAFMLYAPFMLSELGDLLGRWYTGDVGQAFGDLLSGLPVPTITLVENHELWALGEQIKASPLLRRLLDEYEGEAFFAELRNHEEGRAFLAEYEPWRIKRGHRGAADREFMLPRRLDDPTIDYHAFTALMAGESRDPMLIEEERRAIRVQREDEVHASIARGPLGFLKLEVFKIVHGWCLRFMVHRDNEREYLDLLAYTWRRCFVDMGRRLHGKGLIEDPMDVFFLGLEESFTLLRTGHQPELARAKIAGRKRNYLRRQRGEVALPLYLKADGTPAHQGELIGTVSTGDLVDESGARILPGSGTSAGRVTGRARVLHSMSEIGTLEKGDILVCNSTDPGWTPVFLVIDGLVMATGGVLAHGSCLSREYGLPAVVVPEAMSRIEDGVQITVDGSLGRVEIAEAETAATAAAH